MPLSQLTRGSFRTAEFEEPVYKKRTDFYWGATLTSAEQVLLWSADRGGDGNFYAWRGAFPKVVSAGMSPLTSGGLGASGWVSVGDATVSHSYATPMMFGALGGLADDKVALQACINFCQLTGQEMKIDRAHRTSGTLFITSAIKITGTLGSSSIVGTFAAGDVMSVSVTTGPYNGGLTMNGVEVISSVTKTSGYLINLVGSYNTMMDQIILTNGFNGLGITGPASQSTHISNLISANHSNFHLDIQNVSADVVIDKTYLHGKAANDQSVGGVNVKQAGDVTLRAVNTAWCGTDLNVSPGNGQRVQALIVEDCFFDTSTGYGVYAVPTGSGKIDLLKMTDVWACTHNLGGFLIGGSTGVINQLDMIGCTGSNNLGNGLFLNVGAKNATILGCSFSANSQSGIGVAANVGKFKIIGSTCGPSGEFGANGQWGLLIAAGTGSDYIVANNNFSGNPLGGLSEGATGANRVTHPNIGGSGAVRPNSDPAVDWGIEFPSGSTAVIAAGASYTLQTGGGIVAVADRATGLGALFFCTGGTVTKIAGDASIVSGAAALDQLGVDFSGGNYRVGNGFASAKNVTISTIKTSLLS